MTFEQKESLSNNTDMSWKLRMNFDQKEMCRRSVDCHEKYWKIIEHEIKKARKNIDRLNKISNG